MHLPPSLSVEDGDGFVGEVEAVHLDGRSGVLFLELDHRRRDLALQFFLHLAQFGFAHRTGQGDFWLDAGVRSHPLGQQALKLHLLQEFGAVADTDGDVLPGDADGAPVQKAVDGHTIPLHLLHQLPQGRFIQ